jgi:hypothetical protein
LKERFVPTPTAAVRFRPSSKPTRFVYGAALILVALPLILQVRYAWALFVQMPSNPNVVNPIAATFTVLVALAVLLIVAYRLRGLLTGRFRLDLLATRGAPHALRAFSLLLMYAGVAIVVLTVIARVTTGIGAVMLVAGMFQSLLPVGLVLFEFSRLLERERLLERRET